MVPSDKFCGDCGGPSSSSSGSANTRIENGEVILEQDGALSDLPDHMISLTRGITPWDKLIIDVCDGDDFLQFFFAEGVVQLDFPLITPRQNDLSSQAFSILSGLNLFPFLAETDDGEKILVCDFKDADESIAKKPIDFATQLYGISPNTPVQFTLMGPSDSI